MVYAAVIKYALAGKFIGDLGSRQSIFIRLGTLSHLQDEDFSKICPPLKKYQVFLFMYHESVLFQNNSRRI